MPKRLRPAAALLIAAALCLAGCADSGGTASSVTDVPASAAPPAAVDSVPPAPSPAASAPPDGAAENAFVNMGLVDYMGQPLSALKGAFSGDYFLYMVGDLRGALEFYDPFILFYFDPASCFDLSGKQGNTQDPDPFTTTLSNIFGIQLLAEVDPASQTVADQGSLRLLFPTEEQITYALLAEQLGQSPGLTHSPGGGYLAKAPHTMGFEQYALPDGTYYADYELGRWAARISFIKAQADYVALSVVFENENYYADLLAASE